MAPARRARGGVSPPAAFASAPVVVLSSIDWDTAWQRHQIFASQFAAAGRKVLFVENTGFRNPRLADSVRLGGRLRRLASRPPRLAAPAGVEVLAPATLPPTLPLFRAANARWLVPRVTRRLKAAGAGPAPVVVIYVPTPTTLALLDSLTPSLVVYDCASNFSDHPDAPADFAEVERALLDRADLVVTDSRYLYDLQRPRHPRVVRIHQGVDEAFLAAKPASGGFRSFCYYGTWGSALDAELVGALSRAGFDVTLSGFVKGPPPDLPAAVRRLPAIPREELLGRLEAFDAFLLPYCLTPFHKGVIPAKTYEILAMGRPALATPLPSMGEFKEHFYLGATPAEWVAAAHGLPRTETPERAAARRELARSHTYAAEFARLEGAMSEAWDARRRP